MAQKVKNPPEKGETWVQSLGWEDPLEESMATHCIILAWRILMDRGAWWAAVHGVPKSHKELDTHTSGFWASWVATVLKNLPVSFFKDSRFFLDS